MHPMSAATTAIISASLVCALAAACGDKVTIIECPPNTEPRGSECIPLGSGGDDGTTSDAATDSALDLPEFPRGEVDEPDDGGGPTPDPGPGGDDGGGTPDASDGDGGDAGPLVGAVGAICTKGEDCATDACLDWPGGYCTRLDCQEEGCPAGSVCAPVAGNFICLASCEDDGDCRDGGEQACKRVEGESEELIRACFGVSADAGATGDTCQTAVDCQGAAACLSDIVGKAGYCAEIGCEAGGCPEDPKAKCIDFGGRPTCLASCEDDHDCGDEEGAEQRCGVLRTLGGDPTGACISGNEGKPVGAQCTNDLECTSGTCQILGEGRCSQTDQPCFPDTADQDCGTGFFCRVEQGRVGTCSQPCSVQQPCQGAGSCVGQPGDAEGWCRRGCGGLGDADDCRQDAGFVCAYGWPLGGTTGQGSYVCMHADPGDVGATCGASQTCPGGQCEIPAGAETGTCTRPCGDDLYCPFPGRCADDGICRKSCLSVADCPDGTACEDAVGVLGDICR